MNLLMIKIAICDDEEKELSKTKQMCEDFLSEHPEYNVKVSIFQSPELLLQTTEQEKYDILLLDIYMPEYSGVELARIWKGRDEECQIVFLTTSTAHAVEAFSLHAVHYLVKPYTEQQLEDALTKAITTVYKNRKAQITLKIPGGVQKINYERFLYSETNRHLQEIHMMDGKCISTRITCMELYDLISDDNRFFKCGSTYIINLDFVEEITTKYIVFESSNKIPMQRRQYKELLRRYTDYSLGGN